jgi:phospholipid/cholesterol/gamma-HCH transport system substrate-binding protein
VKVKVTPEFRAGAFSFRAGIIVLIVIVVGLVLAFKAQTGMPYAPTTTVSAYFNDIGSLEANDTVREDSKIVGRVSKVAYVDGKALVTMSLNGHKSVYANATAEIWDLSALATKFVELNPGTAGAGAIAAPISAAHTKSSADLYQVLDVLDPKTRAAATSLIRQVGSGLAGHAQDLSDFLQAGPQDLADLQRVSQALADPSADLTGLLSSAKALSSRFNGSEQQIADLMSQSAATLDAVGTEQGKPLSQTIAELPSTLTNLNTAMAKLRQPLTDTRLAMVALQPGAQALGRATPDLRALLRDAIPVLGQIPGVAQDAMPALASLTTTMTDGRPLAPRVRNALASAATPLAVLAPYTTDLSQLFLRAASFVSQGPRPGLRYARLGISPGINTVTGGLLSSGSTGLPQDNYPAPGQAQHDRATGLVPPGVPK